MVVLIVCIRRNPRLSSVEFSAYWREKHGPLVASVPEFIRHVRHYVQYHLIDAEDLPFPLFGDFSDYDGVAALTFDDPETIERAMSEPRYLEIIRPDEANFIDAERCMSFVTHANVVHASVSTVA